MLVTSCGNDIDDEGGSSIVSGDVVAFSVNLKQDWNTLNAQTKSPPSWQPKTTPLPPTGS